jgi:hypothetical protein
MGQGYGEMVVLQNYSLWEGSKWVKPCWFLGQSQIYTVRYWRERGEGGGRAYRWVIDPWHESIRVDPGSWMVTINFLISGEYVRSLINHGHYWVSHKSYSENVWTVLTMSEGAEYRKMLGSISGIWYCFCVPVYVCLASWCVTHCFVY